MKTIFNKHIYALLFINLLLLTSCDKSDKAEIPEPIKQDSCKLINVSSSDSKNSLNIDFEYNSKGNLVKETTVSQSATIQLTYVKVMTYNSSDQLLKYNVTRNGQHRSSVIYEYKDGRVHLENSYDASGNLSSSKEYIYDPQNRIRKEIYSEGSVKEYTYDANGNISKFEVSKDDIVYVRQTYDNYDNKHNFLKSIKGFYNIYALISPNNPGREQINFYGIDDYYEVINYSYKYNSEGWPIERTTTDDQKSYNTVTNYTYKCD